MKFSNGHLIPENDNQNMFLRLMLICFLESLHTVVNNEPKHVGNRYKHTFYFSFVAFLFLPACYVFFFKLLTRLLAGLVLTFFSSLKAIASTATVIFKDHKNFQKETCLIDCLKELIPVLQIMTFAVTHKPVHKTICAMNAFHTFLLQSSLFIPVLKPIFHLLILHDFAHVYLSESHTSL